MELPADLLPQILKQISVESCGRCTLARRSMLISTATIWKTRYESIFPVASLFSDGHINPTDWFAKFRFAWSHTTWVIENDYSAGEVQSSENIYPGVKLAIQYRCVVGAGHPFLWLDVNGQVWMYKWNHIVSIMEGARMIMTSHTFESTIYYILSNIGNLFMVAGGPRLLGNHNTIVHVRSINRVGSKFSSLALIDTDGAGSIIRGDDDETEILSREETAQIVNIEDRGRMNLIGGQCVVRHLPIPKKNHKTIFFRA